MWFAVAAVVGWVAGPAACDRNADDGVAVARPQPAQPSTKPTTRPEVPVVAPTVQRPTRYDAAPRVVALGDVHGDLAATKTALRLAGAIGDTDEAWTGGALVVVQTGDQLDRGDDEQAIVDLLETLTAQAEAAGGAMHVLNGNHEFMNVAGDLRYVTEGGLADFRDVPGLALDDPRLAEVPEPARARMAAFVPGGPYARVLGTRNTVVIVGRTVFVHGGVLPQHVGNGVPDLERLNADARRWLNGAAGADADAIATMIMRPDSVVWTRVYADDDPQTCATLVQTLRALDVDRMVVGHTVQQSGITSACGERLWRIDVGMARHYGGTAQVLAIEGDDVRVIGPGA